MQVFYKNLKLQRSNLGRQENYLHFVPIVQTQYQSISHSQNNDQGPMLTVALLSLKHGTHDYLGFTITVNWKGQKVWKSVCAQFLWARSESGPYYFPLPRNSLEEEMDFGEQLAISIITSAFKVLCYCDRDISIVFILYNIQNQSKLLSFSNH